MKKQVFLIGLVLATSLAHAGAGAEQDDTHTTEAEQLAQINATLAQLLAVEVKQSATAPDDNRFCYEGGEAFSEGAVHNGLTCYRDGVRVAIPGQPAPVDPLRWAKIKRDRPVLQIN